MKNTRFMLANKETIIDLLNGTSPDSYKTLDANMICKSNYVYIKKTLSKVPNIKDFLINDEYFCLIYMSPSENDDKSLKIKICSVYDKKFNFIEKGTLKNVAKFLGIIDGTEYVDVSNIESKPDLLLKIIKAYMPSTLPVTLQEIADEVLKDCKSGKKYAQFLIKPKHPIELICEKEGISRAEISRNTGIGIPSIENSLSTGTCGKKMLEKLRKVYKYV